MKATFLTLAVSALLPTLRADEKDTRDFFAVHVTKLPICDRVEVIRLDKPDSFRKESELTEEFKSTHYQIWPPEAWCKELGTVTLKGPDAERLAALYRAFQEYRHDKGSGWSICHDPPYAYRFYSGKKLVNEVSICWKCHNLLIGPEGKAEFVYFKKEVPEAQQLLDACNKLFPAPPSK